MLNTSLVRECRLFVEDKNASIASQGFRDDPRGVLHPTEANDRIGALGTEVSRKAEEGSRRSPVERKVPHTLRESEVIGRRLVVDSHYVDLASELNKAVCQASGDDRHRTVRDTPGEDCDALPCCGPCRGFVGLRGEVECSRRRCAHQTRASTPEVPRSTGSATRFKQRAALFAVRSTSSPSAVRPCTA